MICLAIDTSSATGSVALTRDGTALAERTLTSLPGHSETLLFAISMMLSGAGLALQDVDLLAAGVGPGSFTGLRVGLSAMKGLHLASGKPLLGVSSLCALAMNSDRSDQSDRTDLAPFVCAAIDARRGDVFATAYRSGDAAFLQVLPEQMTRPPELLTMLEGLGGQVLCLGDAFSPQPSAISIQLPAQRAPAPVTAAAPLVPAAPFMTVPADPRLHLTSAVQVAAIAAARHARGESDNAAGLEPRYVRPIEFKTA